MYVTAICQINDDDATAVPCLIYIACIGRRQQNCHDFLRHYYSTNRLSKNSPSQVRAAHKRLRKPMPLNFRPRCDLRAYVLRLLA